MSLRESGEKIVISASIQHEDFSETIFVLLKNEDIDEYYLTVSVWGWVQVSDIQRNFGELIRHKYYVKKEVVPLIYYILTTDPKKLDDIFEFLYQNYFIYPEEDDEE
jgi:hypothetical protein